MPCPACLPCAGFPPTPFRSLPLGLGMIGQSAVFPNGFPWNKKSAGQKSRVATGILAMELDHDTGKMTGTVLSGPFKGASLEEMDPTDLAVTL